MKDRAPLLEKADAFSPVRGGEGICGIGGLFYSCLFFRSSMDNGE